MTICVIIRCQLGFNIRQRDIPSDADIRSLAYMWDIQVQIIHHRIVAVGVVVVEQLLAEDPFGCGIAVIETIEVGEAESPIDVIGLYGVGKTLEYSAT